MSRRSISISWRFVMIHRSTSNLSSGVSFTTPPLVGLGPSFIGHSQANTVQIFKTKGVTSFKTV
ncbi:exported protein of unknown function [Candidatus Nitrospira inopinata]|uniref:Uncharacterized protein n=1 Tax=Candidatus Nitrospira inopinata TaxID=1715989 RepID=A0A0S4KQ71_9BACT|nr:exported protein of unknown function [Candidatus Nitrospira inopinata]